MPSDQVNASPADLRKLASALSAYQQQVKAASKQVRGALDHANWNDSRKAQFESRYKDLDRRIDGFLSGEVAQMIKSLKELARKLDDIRSTRL